MQRFPFRDHSRLIAGQFSAESIRTRVSTTWRAISVDIFGSRWKENIDFNHTFNKPKPTFKLAVMIRATTKKSNFTFSRPSHTHLKSLRCYSCSPLFIFELWRSSEPALYVLNTLFKAPNCCEQQGRRENRVWSEAIVLYFRLLLHSLSLSLAWLMKFWPIHFQLILPHVLGS